MANCSLSTKELYVVLGRSSPDQPQSSLNASCDNSADVSLQGTLLIFHLHIGTRGRQPFSMLVHTHEVERVFMT